MKPPDFGRSVNPISTKGGRLCPPNNTGTPGFSDLICKGSKSLMFEFLFKLAWTQGCFYICSYSNFSKAFPKSLLTVYISILFLCRTNNSTTTRLMVSFWPTAVLSSKALTGHDLEDTPVKHSMLSVVVKAKSLSSTSNVRHLFIIRSSNFFIKRKITVWFDEKNEHILREPEVDLRAIFLVKLHNSELHFVIGLEKSWIFAPPEVSYATEVDLRANFLVKSHQGHGLEDTPVKHSSLLVVAKCKYRKALHPIISIIWFWSVENIKQ